MDENILKHLLDNKEMLFIYCTDDKTIKELIEHIETKDQHIYIKNKKTNFFMDVYHLYQTLKHDEISALGISHLVNLNFNQLTSKEQALIKLLLAIKDKGIKSIIIKDIYSITNQKNLVPLLSLLQASSKSVYIFSAHIVNYNASILFINKNKFNYFPSMAHAKKMTNSYYLSTNRMIEHDQAYASILSYSFHGDIIRFKIKDKTSAIKIFNTLKNKAQIDYLVLESASMHDIVSEFDLL